MQYNKDDNSCHPKTEPEQPASEQLNIIELATLPTDNMFDPGKYTLTKDAKEKLSKTNVSNFITNNHTYCIEVNGYSDSSGWNKCAGNENEDSCNTAANKEISLERAKAVASALKLTESNDNCKTIKIQGLGCKDTNNCVRTVKIETCDLADTCTSSNK